MDLDLGLEGLLSFLEYFDLVGLVGFAHLCYTLASAFLFSFQLLSVLKVSTDLHSPVDW